MNTVKALAISLIGFMPAVLNAQKSPEIVTLPALNGGAFKSMSQSGEWLVGDATNPADESTRAYPRIYNTLTGKETRLFTAEQDKSGIDMGANCVSNDGKTVGGNFESMPAVWTETGGWKKLPVSVKNAVMGTVSAITPDGRYAVGRVNDASWFETPCLWDLTALKAVETPGLMTSNPRYKDMVDGGGDPNEWPDVMPNVRFTGITPDGKKILGTVDFIYPQTMWEFIYDVDARTWKALGYELADGRFKPLDDDIYNVDECFFSADGSYIGGLYYSNGENYAPFRCPTAAPDSFELFGDAESYGVWAVGSDGTLYGATPTSTPLRDWYVNVGKYWFDWKMVLRQIYGIDWQNDITKDDTGYSGTVNAVSIDNKKILAVDWGNKNTYVVTLPEPLKDICGQVNLLADYSVFPPQGAQFSRLQTITLSMGRDVEVTGEKTAVQVLDESGEAVKTSINFGTQPGNSTKVEITFRNFDMDAGKKYTVLIPAGSIQVAGDPERTCRDIRISYLGRSNSAVSPVKISPADGSDVACINYSTNPIYVNFDAIVDVTGEGMIGLYQISDGKEEFLYNLNASLNGSQMVVFPVSEQRLALGNDYRIDFSAGLVADLSGAGANEAFSVTFHGSYVPEINVNSNIIFSETFDAGYGFGEFMLYEGDHNNPAQTVQAWGFADGDNFPWWVARDTEETADQAAVSHSMYSPAGQSDDWMVTRQLYIPDEKANLSFKSQSYLNGKEDHLKVYIWESNDVVTILTPQVVDKMRYGGKLVYDEVQSPGASEEMLEGEWRHNNISLAPYAGKNIYIAFVNDNRNQSAVFVDDVVVSREVLGYVVIDTEPTVIDADEIQIKGRVQVMRPGGLYGMTLTLSDSEGKQLFSVDDDAVYEEGEVTGFNFPPVALKKGSDNYFSVTMASGNSKVAVDFDIKNMAFVTKRRFVVEEFTGTTCPNCPRGIMAMENLLDIYGDRCIPVTIHAYTGDAFGNSELSAYAQHLGLMAAPSGRVDRGVIADPMPSVNYKDFYFTSDYEPTWVSEAERVLAELPEADVEISGARIDDGKVKVDFNVNYALSKTGVNVNVLGILMEDHVFGVQDNNYASYDSETLGEWRKGEAYGKSKVPYYYDDVVRGTSAVFNGVSYAGFNGIGGYVPTDIKAGEPMDISFEFAMPNNVKDPANTKVCVVLIDAKSGEVLNAAVRSMDDTSVGGMASEAIAGNVYDLSGRLVMTGATPASLQTLDNGIYILNGRKYAVAH